LIILAAGERTLFDDCQTCFEAMGRNSFYLGRRGPVVYAINNPTIKFSIFSGDVGNASKMNLVLQTMAGVCLAGLAEAMALGVYRKDFFF
jgi:3-hydroxyisobutyrate dehydrogenase